jgi:hypothetical protein
LATAKTTIELNGKRYDAITGKIISDSQAISTITKPVVPLSSGALDGFSRRPQADPSNTHNFSSHLPKRSTKIKPNPSSRSLEKSKTLMRPAVKKPVIKNDIQSQKRVRLEKPQAINHARAARAVSAPKSPMISRFLPANSGIVKKTAHLQVATPAQEIHSSIAHAETSITKHIQSLENAVHNSTSHLEQEVVEKVSLAKRYSRRHKLASIAAASCAFLLLVGFFGYQNKAIVEMRVAAARSGVSANLPGYKPAGYGIVGSVKSEPGTVSVSFKSRTDDRSFNITQKASNWNSSALLANSVAKGKDPYQTYQNNGRTVYIYNNSNATWVDGGVWYKVEGNANLTSDQLLRLANSF